MLNIRDLEGAHTDARGAGGIAGGGPGSRMRMVATAQEEIYDYRFI
jgi:hypothetical protein